MVPGAQAAESRGVQSWDGVVTGALDTSGVDGTVMLGSSMRPVEVPPGLPALMSALLHFIAPEAPRRLRVYTYDVFKVGSLLEVRGARLLNSLPDQLTELAEQLGIKLNHFRLAGSSAVLLTLPVARS